MTTFPQDYYQNNMPNHLQILFLECYIVFYMICRKGCGACCIVISISSAIPGMPDGKPAGISCVNLKKDLSCKIHGTAEYPDVCREFRATTELCGETDQQARKNLKELEELTS